MLRLLFLVGVVTFLTPAPAKAEQMHATMYGGGFYVAKQTPTRVSKVSPHTSAEWGLSLTSRSTVKFRSDFYRIDGINMNLVLLAEQQVLPFLSVFLGSGISVGEASGPGGILTTGVVPFIEFSSHWSLRLELAVAAALRNDFGGTGVRMQAGLGYSWN